MEFKLCLALTNQTHIDNKEDESTIIFYAEEVALSACTILDAQHFNEYGGLPI